MAIITLAQAKTQLGIDQAYTGDDAELTQWVGAITGAVEEYKGIVIEQRTVVERLMLCGEATFMLKSVPVISLDSIAAADGSQTWDPASFDVDPDTGRVTLLAGSAPYGLVRATCTAGYAADSVPPRYVQGALTVLQHVWETRRGAMGAQAGVVGGEEAYDPRYSYAIPRKALEWLGAPVAGVA